MDSIHYLCRREGEPLPIAHANFFVFAHGKPEEVERALGERGEVRQPLCLGCARKIDTRYNLCTPVCEQLRSILRKPHAHFADRAVLQHLR